MNETVAEKSLTETTAGDVITEALQIVRRIELLPIDATIEEQTNLTLKRIAAESRIPGNQWGAYDELCADMQKRKGSLAKMKDPAWQNPLAVANVMEMASTRPTPEEDLALPTHIDMARQEQGVGDEDDGIGEEIRAEIDEEANEAVGIPEEPQQANSASAGIEGVAAKGHPMRDALDRTPQVVAEEGKHLRKALAKARAAYARPHKDAKVYDWYAETDLGGEDDPYNIAVYNNSELRATYETAFAAYRDFIFKTRGLKAVQEFSVSEEGMWGNWSGRFGMSEHKWKYITAGVVGVPIALVAMGPIRLAAGATVGAVTRFGLHKTGAAETAAQFLETKETKENINTVIEAEKEAKKNGMSLVEFEQKYAAFVNAYKSRIRRERYAKTAISSLFGAGMYTTFNQSLVNELIQDANLENIFGSELTNGLFRAHTGTGKVLQADMSAGVFDSLSAAFNKIKNSARDFWSSKENRSFLFNGFFGDRFTWGNTEENTTAITGKAESQTPYVATTVFPAVEVTTVGGGRVTVENATVMTGQAVHETPYVATTVFPAVEVTTARGPDAATIAQASTPEEICLTLEKELTAKGADCAGIEAMLRSIRRQLMGLQKKGLQIPEGTLAYRLVHANNGGINTLIKEIGALRPENSSGTDFIVGKKDFLTMNKEGHLEYHQWDVKTKAFKVAEVANCDDQITANEGLHDGHWMNPDKTKCDDCMPKTAGVLPTLPRMKPEMAMMTPHDATGNMETAQSVQQQEIIPAQSFVSEVCTAAEWREFHGRQFSVMAPQVFGNYTQRFNAPVLVVKATTLEDAYAGVLKAKIPEGYQAGARTLGAWRVILIEDCNGNMQCVYVYPNGTAHWSRITDPHSRAHAVFMDDVLNVQADEVGPIARMGRGTIGGDFNNKLPPGKGSLYIRYGFDERGGDAVLRRLSPTDSAFQTADMYTPPSEGALLKSLPDGTLVYAHENGTLGIPTLSERTENALRADVKYFLQDAHPTPEKVSALNAVLSKPIPREFIEMKGTSWFPGRSTVNRSMAGNIIFKAFENDLLSLTNKNADEAGRIARRMSELYLEFDPHHESNRFSFDANAYTPDSFESYERNSKFKGLSYYHEDGSVKTGLEFLTDANHMAAELGMFGPATFDSLSLSIGETGSFADYDGGGDAGGDSGSESADAGAEAGDSGHTETAQETHIAVTPIETTVEAVESAPMVLAENKTPLYVNDNELVQLPTEPVIDTQTEYADAIHTNLDWTFGNGNIGSGVRALENLLAANDNPTVGDILRTNRAGMSVEKVVALDSLQKFILDHANLLDGVDNSTIGIRNVFVDRGLLAA